jgi:hypothetical protein
MWDGNYSLFALMTNDNGVIRRRHTDEKPWNTDVHVEELRIMYSYMLHMQYTIAKIRYEETYTENTA